MTTTPRPSKTPARAQLLDLLKQHGIKTVLRDLGGIALTRNVLANHGHDGDDAGQVLTRQQWLALYRELNALALNLEA